MKLIQEAKIIVLLFSLFFIKNMIAQQIEVLTFEDGAIFGIPYNYPGYLYCDDIETCLKGNNIVVYNNNQKIEAIGNYGNGHIASFSDGGIYISERGKQLGSGKKVRSHGQSVKYFVPFKGGVITVFEEGGIYWSPDGSNLGGPKPTQKLYYTRCFT